MGDIKLIWDGVRADFGLLEEVRNTFALQLANGSHVDLGDVADLGTSDFRIKLRAKPAALNTVQPLVAKYSGDIYLGLPGLVTAYASTPHSAALGTITQDLDVRVRLAMNDWTPSTLQVVISKDNGEEHRAWTFFVYANGRLGLGWEDEEVVVHELSSTAATGFADGADGWIRVTLDGNNGAGDAAVRFYTSTDGSSWSQLGATVLTGATTTIRNATDARLQVSGGEHPDLVPLAGKVYYAEVRATEGGAVIAKLDAAAATPGAGSLVSSTGETWTLAGTAVFVQPPGWQLYWDTTGDLRLTLSDAAGGYVSGVLAPAANWAVDVEREIEVTVLRAGNATCKRDGVAVGTLNIAAAAASLDNSLSLLLGSNGNGDFYDGLLDTVAIYKGTFDAAGLEGLWLFDEGLGDVAQDSSSHGRTGTLVDEPAWVRTGPPNTAYDLETEDGLETAILLSLFSDRRAAESDVLPDMGDDRRGWWGDALPVVAGDELGSKLWLLQRAKQTPDVLGREEQYAREALAWLTQDQVASSVEVTASTPSAGVLQWDIAVQRPRRRPVQYRFSAAWAAQAGEV
jgi:phage gp46-like protein